MKNLAPNEEVENSNETAEIAQENSSVSADNSSGLDLGEIVADTIEFVSGFFDD